MPIWAHIHNLPLEYWTTDGLSYIASAIGKPIYVDCMTAACRRISYARICIEVSAEDELLKTLEIGSDDTTYGEPEKVSLKVEYPWTPVRCAHCKKFGHDCARNPKPIHTNTNTNTQDQQGNDHEARGNWMKQGRRKKNSY